jgi:hypothetical protein
VDPTREDLRQEVARALGLRVGEELSRRVLLDDPALVHEGDAGGCKARRARQPRERRNGANPYSSLQITCRSAAASPCSKASGWGVVELARLDVDEPAPSP